MSFKSAFTVVHDANRSTRQNVQGIDRYNALHSAQYRYSVEYTYNALHNARFKCNTLQNARFKQNALHNARFRSRDGDDKGGLGRPPTIAMYHRSPTIALYCIALHYITYHDITSNCRHAMYYIVLHYIALYCLVLGHPPQRLPTQANY